MEVVAGICSGTATQDVYVKPVPLADFGSVAVPSDLCSPVAIQFNGGGSLGADTLLWNFGNGDTDGTNPSNPISRTFANTTSAPVQRLVEMTAVSAGGCRDSLVKSYTIQPQIRAAFSISDTIGCSPLTTTFVNESNQPGNSNGAATSYVWLRDGANAGLPENPGTLTRGNPSATTVLTENWQLVAGNGICIDTSAVQASPSTPNLWPRLLPPT